MKCKAEVSFSGLIVMAKGQEKDIPEGAVLDELLRCGYVSPVEEKESPEKENENDEAERNKSRRGKGGNKG